MIFLSSSTMVFDIRDHNLALETHNTYDVSFYTDSIFTTVTHDPDKVSEWIPDVEYAHRPRLSSLIVEWRPSFDRGVRNRVAVRQLCVGRRCLAYQISHSSYVSVALKNFLSDRDYTFVGVGIYSDLEKLDNNYQFGGIARRVDLGSLAAEEYERRELKNWGLKELGRFVLGAEQKPRAVTLSGWDHYFVECVGNNVHKVGEPVQHK